jgi:hypothetical protein
MNEIVVDDAVYVVAPEYRVVRLAGDAQPVTDPLHVFEDEGVAIVAAGTVREGQVLDRPVYRRAPHGSPVLPTGRIFVRFADGDHAESHRAAIEAAGYHLERVPPWAPNGAWVCHASGDVRESLAGLERLRQLPGVQHVEPELLRPRSLRSA